MTYSTIEWLKDFLPKQHTYITFLKKIYRNEFRKNGFKRITTTLLEKKDLVEKSKSIEKNILENPIFEIRQKPYLWIMRAYLNWNFQDDIQPLYFYFMEEYVNFKNWELNEDLLIWSEIIWEDDAILDAIQISINYQSLCKIWLKDKFKIKINSTWVEKEKIKFKEELINFYDNKRNILSPESQELIEKNPLIILKSENEDEKILNENAPNFTKKFLKKESKEHYKKFKEYLEILEVPYEEDNYVVNDDENQTKSIWNFKTNSWIIIAEWYRHNCLSKNLWTQKEIPATGFWLYTSKVIDLMIENNIKVLNKDEIDLFFVQLWDEAKKTVLPISIKARQAWIRTVTALWTTSMKEQMLMAQKSEAHYVVMVWIMEARNGIFQLRNQKDWTQTEIKKEDLIDFITEKIWEDKLTISDHEKDIEN